MLQNDWPLSVPQDLPSMNSIRAQPSQALGFIFPTVWEAGVIISASAAPKGHCGSTALKIPQRLGNKTLTGRSKPRCGQKERATEPCVTAASCPGLSLRCDLQRLGGTVLNRRGSAQPKGLWLEYAAATGEQNGDRFLDCGNPKNCRTRSQSTTTFSGQVL